MNIARDMLFLHGYFASPANVRTARDTRATPVPVDATPVAVAPFREAVARACRVPALQWRLAPPRLFDGLPGWAEPAADRPVARFGPRYGNRVASLDWFGGVRDGCATPAPCC